MAAALLESMAANEVFIPTLIPEYQGEMVGFIIGDILLGFSCKALLYGECLMTLGGYVVRGMVLGCGKRAKAVRRSDGTFERVNLQHCLLALEDRRALALEDAAPPQPQPQQLPPPTDDMAAAASSIYLKIQKDTPSPASSKEAKCLMPELEQQAAIEASELPLQDKIKLHENAIQQLVQQQFDQDTATQTVASINAGKRPLPPHNHDHDDKQVLLDEIAYLKDQLQQRDTNKTTTVLVHMDIATPISNRYTQL